jgi:hypothetical protein
VTLSGSNSYTGNVTLTCALTSSPAGATNVPACSVTGGPVSLSSTATTGTATVTASTTAQTAGALRGSKWFTAAGE